MLRVVQNKSAAGAKSYYSQADYLSEGQEIVGHWGGKAAAMLGLQGEVQKKDFEALCDNLDPRTGERLTARTDSDRTVGYDFVFDVPKGVSVAYALTQDQRILEAFRASVRETMQELELETKTRVRTKGRNEEKVTGNLCWANFLHFTARPVDGEPDPHLHAHCFAMNTTFDETENRFKAGFFRDLKRDARYYESAASARLAKRLNELGYATERRGKSWDLAAIPKSLSEKFSRRKQLIEKEVKTKEEEKGPLTADEKSELGAKTREKKQKELSMTELRKIWLERLSDSERALLHELGKGQGPVLVANRDADSRSLDHAITHCFERNSVVAEKELLAEALRHGVGQVSVEGVKQQLSQKDVISGRYRGRDMVTTDAVLSEEKSLIRFAKEGRGTAAALNGNWTIKCDWLNEGQQSAVRHVVQSNDRVLMIKGKAGTGKTSLMKEAVDAIEAGGHQVFVFAPSAEASRGVLAAEGFSATTVAELLVNEKLQQATAGQVIWIDEAGLLGTRTLKQVFDLAERNNCLVVLSGDWKQHSSVERGAAMRLLEQEAGIKPAIVTENQRQQPMEYRSVVDLIANDELGKAFDRLDQIGWIREFPDELRNAEIARDYGDCVEGKESVLVVCPTHAEGERVSQAIRGELKSRNLLKGKDHTILRLIPLHLTEGERADPHSYEPGDVLVFHQNAKGHCKGERLMIAGPVPKEFTDLAKHFQVFHESQLTVAKGDLLRITMNGKTADGKHRLNNGSTYKIAAIGEEGDIRLTNGWTVNRDYGFLSLGYVQTSQSSQGRTVDQVLIAEPSHSFGAASREQFYVSSSRGRHRMRVYCDDKVALKAAVHRTEDRIAATQLMNDRIDDAELRRLHAARAMILATQASEKKPEKTWELIYGH